MAADEIASDAATSDPPAGWDSGFHPWRRYGGRMIDVELFGLVGIVPIMILVYLVDEAAGDWLTSGSRLASYLVLAPLAWLLSIPFTAFCLSRWSTTPGKLLFGVRVVSQGGGKLSYREALRRELSLLVWGVGLGLPLISLFAMIRSYADLEIEHESKWDRQVGSVVLGRMLKGWQMAGLILGTIIVVILKIWAGMSRLTAFAG
jgi:hypothetical protein